MATHSDKEKFDPELLESIFRTSKKTIQEYVREIERRCRFQSAFHSVVNGTVLDDRSRLIDLYEACMQQDAHIASTVETLESQIVGERYMLAAQNEKGRYVKDVEETKKIQGTQFVKIIRGIAEAKLYGYTAIEILPDTDPRTGKLARVTILERRNVLADQKRIVQRQGIWSPGWNFEDKKFSDYYVLINTGGLGLFSATTPLILAKKFTVANYVNFSHTYGQPIIHGKCESELKPDRQRMAHEIASAATNKVIVTGLQDEVDVKTFASVNSEKIFTGLIGHVDASVSNLILGSESMAGATQSYVGATRAHQDIFRDRIAVYREFIENVMNEEIIPRLVNMGYIKPGLEFKYAHGLEMSNEERIQLMLGLSDRFEISPDEIEKSFGIVVGRQLELAKEDALNTGSCEEGDGHQRMSDEEYYRRYGRQRGASASVNFLRERK